MCIRDSTVYRSGVISTNTFYFKKATSVYRSVYRSGRYTDFGALEIKNDFPSHWHFLFEATFVYTSVYTFWNLYTDLYTHLYTLSGALEIKNDFPPNSRFLFEATFVYRSVYTFWNLYTDLYYNTHLYTLYTLYTIYDAYTLSGHLNDKKRFFSELTLFIWINICTTLIYTSVYTSVYIFWALDLK
jgi:hypothetical protein